MSFNALRDAVRLANIVGSSGKPQEHDVGIGKQCGHVYIAFENNGLKYYAGIGDILDIFAKNLANVYLVNGSVLQKYLDFIDSEPEIHLDDSMVSLSHEKAKLVFHNPKKITVPGYRETDVIFFRGLWLKHIDVIRKMKLCYDALAVIQEKANAFVSCKHDKIRLVLVSESLHYEHTVEADIGSYPLPDGTYAIPCNIMNWLTEIDRNIYLSNYIAIKKNIIISEDSAFSLRKLPDNDDRHVSILDEQVINKIKETMGMFVPISASSLAVDKKRSDGKIMAIFSLPQRKKILACLALAMTGPGATVGIDNDLSSVLAKRTYVSPKEAFEDMCFVKLY